MFRCRHLLIAIGLIGSMALPSTAQDVPLAQLLPELIGGTIVLTPGAGFSHEAHFRPGAEQLQAPAQFNGAIVTLLSTFPLGSSSGGFTYTFDPTVGTFSRASQTFGPIFAERALTIGRRRFAFGMNYQHARYDTFEGKELRDNEIKFYIRHIDCCSLTDLTRGDGSNLTPFFEGDIVEAALSLDLKTDTVTLFGNYGVTDRLEVSMVVPIIRVDLNANVQATIERLATAAISTRIHQFDGLDSRTFTSAGSSSGIGDVVLRGKYHLLAAGGGGLAAALDLRLPTGDEENLLGTGATQGKLYLIGSAQTARVAPHFNIGYTFSGEGEGAFGPNDEFNYATGVEIAPLRTVTIAADLIGRSLIDAGRLADAEKVFQFTTPTGTLGSVTRTEFALEEGNLNLVVGAVGVKFNPTGTLLISVNLLFPLTDAGLRDRITPTIGFDYSF